MRPLFLSLHFFTLSFTFVLKIDKFTFVLKIILIIISENSFHVRYSDLNSELDENFSVKLRDYRYKYQIKRNLTEKLGSIT